MHGNVALVGAPQTGKTALAWGLQQKLEGYSLVDGYAEFAGTQMDVAVGLWAPYMINSIIAADRLRRELALSRRGLNYICVGTVVDTIVYQSIHSSRIAEQSEREIFNAQMMMAWLGAIFQDQWNYNHVFYLPYEGDEQVHQFYDAQLQEALGLYQIPYARLTGTPEENVEQAFDNITAEPVDSTAADLEELGVREGGSDGEEVGDSAEPVPSVPDEAGSDRREQLRRADWTDLQVPGD